MDRYSFDVGLFHPQLHAGFSRRFRLSWLYPKSRADAERRAIRRAQVEHRDHVFVCADVRKII